MRVMYVPQRPALLPGSPDKFIESIVQLGSHQHAHRGSDPKTVLSEVKARAHKIGLGWDVDPELWQRDWISLSGGEGQRMLLAAALAFDVAELMLLDGSSPYPSKLGLYFMFTLFFRFRTDFRT